MLVYTQDEMNEFVEDIVRCFSTESGWGGLLFDVNKIEEAITLHTNGIVSDDEEVKNGAFI